MAASKFTPELAQRIATLYGEGKTFVQVSAEVGVGEWTIHAWERDKPEFASLMQLARTVRAEREVDGMDDMVRRVGDPQLARVLSDNARWRASKWAKRYAEKVQVDVVHQVSIAAALEAGEARVAALSGPVPVAPMIEARVIQPEPQPAVDTDPLDFMS